MVMFNKDEVTILGAIIKSISPFTHVSHVNKITKVMHVLLSEVNYIYTHTQIHAASYHDELLSTMPAHFAMNWLSCQQYIDKC